MTTLPMAIQMKVRNYPLSSTNPATNHRSLISKTETKTEWMTSNRNSAIPMICCPTNPMNLGANCCGPNCSRRSWKSYSRKHQNAIGCLAILLGDDGLLLGEDCDEDGDDEGDDEPLLLLDFGQQPSPNANTSHLSLSAKCFATPYVPAGITELLG